MNLYHIQRMDQGDYDTYSDAVVVAETADEARMIHPAGTASWGELKDDNYTDGVKTGWIENWNGFKTMDSSWVPPTDIKITPIGVADPPFKAGTVICVSYHAG